MSRRLATASQRCSLSTTPSSIASESSDRTSLEGSSCVTTGEANTVRSTSKGRLDGSGIEDDAAFVGEPQGNGVAERFIRTLKEQCLWSRLFFDVDDLRQGVANFIETYNNEWLIERLGHRTPREAFIEATAEKAA